MSLDVEVMDIIYYFRTFAWKVWSIFISCRTNKQI